MYVFNVMKWTGHNAEPEIFRGPGFGKIPGFAKPLREPQFLVRREQDPTVQLMAWARSVCNRD